MTQHLASFHYVSTDGYTSFVSMLNAGTLQKDGLYFVATEGQLYRVNDKGVAETFGGWVVTRVTADPTSPAINTLYINTTNGSVKYYDGSTLQYLVQPASSGDITSGDSTKFPTAAAVKSYVDTKTADLSNKANKATSLSGYGITDAYTKTQTDSAIATAVAGAGHLKRVIVATLPDVASADENTIYMVGSGSGSTSSNYKEYMLINGAFELIGDSETDLTGYATETFVTNKIAALDVTDTAVTNQYVSKVSETDGKISVTRATLPVYSVATGTSNGTISVNGSNVAVKGLGSAAYTATTAYDASGAAATALTSAKSYSDTNLSAAKAYADTNLATAKTYTETLLTWDEI